jgi:hypothetical protein
MKRKEEWIGVGEIDLEGCRGCGRDKDDSKPPGVSSANAGFSGQTFFWSRLGLAIFLRNDSVTV